MIGLISRLQPLIIGMLLVSLPVMMSRVTYGAAYQPTQVSPEAEPNPFIPIESPLSGVELVASLFNISSSPNEALNDSMILLSSIDATILRAGVTGVGAPRSGVSTTVSFGELHEYDRAFVENAEQYNYVTTVEISTEFSTVAVGAMVFVTVIAGEGSWVYVLPLVQVPEVLLPAYSGDLEDSVNLSADLSASSAAGLTASLCRQWYNEDRARAAYNFRRCVVLTVGIWNAVAVIACGISAAVVGAGTGGVGALPTFLTCLGISGGTGTISSLVGCLVAFLDARDNAVVSYRRCLQMVPAATPTGPLQPVPGGDR